MTKRKRHLLDQTGKTEVRKAVSKEVIRECENQVRDAENPNPQVTKEQLTKRDRKKTSKMQIVRKLTDVEEQIESQAAAAEQGDEIEYRQLRKRRSSRG